MCTEVYLARAPYRRIRVLLMLVQYMNKCGGMRRENCAEITAAKETSTSGRFRAAAESHVDARRRRYTPAGFVGRLARDCKLFILCRPVGLLAKNPQALREVSRVHCLDTTWRQLQYKSSGRQSCGAHQCSNIFQTFEQTQLAIETSTMPWNIGYIFALFVLADIEEKVLSTLSSSP